LHIVMTILAVPLCPIDNGLLDFEARDRNTEEKKLFLF
jgi:hypothetical protein